MGRGANRIDKVPTGRYFLNRLRPSFFCVTLSSAATVENWTPQRWKIQTFGVVIDPAAQAVRSPEHCRVRPLEDCPPAVFREGRRAAFKWTRQCPPVPTGPSRRLQLRHGRSATCSNAHVLQAPVFFKCIIRIPNRFIRRRLGQHRYYDHTGVLARIILHYDTAGPEGIRSKINSCLWSVPIAMSCTSAADIYWVC